MSEKTKLGDLRRAVRSLRSALSFHVTWTARAAENPHRPHPRDKVTDALERIRQGGIALVPLLEAEPGHRIEPCHIENARQALAEAGEVLRPYLDEVTARHQTAESQN